MTFALLCSAIAATQALSAPVVVPFKIGDDAIVVEARVNGKKASFMFDTGFAGSFVMSDALNIGQPTGTARLRDFVGEFEAKTVKVRSLKLGDLEIEPVGMDVVQQPLEHLSDSYNTHTDGIMGLEVVRNFVTEVNFKDSKFVFHPKSVDISKRVPDNVRTFLVKMLPIGLNAIQMHAETKDGKKMILGLDTGNAFFATTHKDVLEEEGLWPKGKQPDFMRTAWVASGPVDSFYVRLTDLKVFGVPVPSSVWSILDLPSSSSESDGTVGIGFLRNFNVTIDLDRRRVWLENISGKTGNEPAADVGITPVFDPGSKRVRVARVTPGSPAEKAGIQRGDDLLSLDGVELAHRGARELVRMMEGPRGSKVQLAVSRQGNLVRHELSREYLINLMPSKTD